MVGPLSLDRRKLFEQVAQHIQKQILDGALKPGDRLPPERDLQQRFGVGRPAIREALILLRNSGLVEIMSGAPARVAMPTAEGVLQGMMPAVLQMLSTEAGQRHFQDLRLFFETGLARRAASQATDDDLAKLRAALEANRLAMGDRQRFIETDVAFHFVLAEMTRNPVFAALHDGMSSWLKQQRVITLDQPGQERIAFAAHQRICDTISARDPDAAENAMREHLLQLQAAYWEHEKARRAG
jgi:GntR family transcriptional repressor for pyruvate dehydrogenase complex